MTDPDFNYVHIPKEGDRWCVMGEGEFIFTNGKWVKNEIGFTTSKSADHVFAVKDFRDEINALRAQVVALRAIVDRYAKHDTDPYCVAASDPLNYDWKCTCGLTQALQPTPPADSPVKGMS